MPMPRRIRNRARAATSSRLGLILAGACLLLAPGCGDSTSREAGTIQVPARTPTAFNAKAARAQLKSPATRVARP